MTLIADNTADTTDLANVSFTSGIDSTYKLYIFKFWGIGPATDGTDFTFNGSIDGGSNYNVVKTTTFYRAWHAEATSAEGVDVEAEDLAQSANAVNLSIYCGADADESSAGALWLFNPAGTTCIKHFYSTVQMTQGGEGVDSSQNIFTSGYFNDGDDNIDAVQFKMSSGNFDGTIKMYGVG